jgi:hypothetical protein
MFRLGSYVGDTKVSVLRCVAPETVSGMQSACNDGGRETPGKGQEMSPILADGKAG